MKKTAFYLLLVGWVGLILSSCAYVSSQSQRDKNVPLQRVERVFHGCEAIQVSSAINLTVHQSDIPRLVVFSTDAEELKEVKTQMSRSTLLLSRKSERRRSDPAPVYVDLYLPSFSSVQCSGASSVENMDFFQFEHLDVKLSGASSARFSDLYVGKLCLDLAGASTANGSVFCTGVTDVELSGASTCALRGNAEELVVDAGGASSVKMEDYLVESSVVELSGASSAKVSVREYLHYRLSGASSLSYYGNPESVNGDSKGASSVHKR